MDVTEFFATKKRSWAALAVAVALLTALFGLLGGVEGPSGRDAAPATSESTQVQHLLQKFPDAAKQTALAVVSHQDHSPLTAADMQRAGEAIPGIDPTHFTLSQDKAAGIFALELPPSNSGSETATYLDGLRSDIAGRTPENTIISVTGGAAFGADIANAFSGANFTLLAVTIVIVAVLLILTYRSPVLWLIPLIVVALADRLASLVTAWIGTTFSLQFDAGIVSVLVFGAGTNYALLLISRYREELLRNTSHIAALRHAWKKTTGAIVASNVTVVLSLLCLTAALVPTTRGLGVVSAVGLLIAVVSVLFVLPPALAVCGRGAFWPRIPRPDSVDHASTGLYHRVATGVMKRPLAILAAGVITFGGLSLTLLGTNIGLNQMEQFRTPTESAAGFATLEEHFPAGEAQPSYIVAPTDSTREVLSTVNTVPGVVHANPIGQSEDKTLTKIMVVGEAAPGTTQSHDFVRQLRVAVHPLSSAHSQEILVGGQAATEVDARDANMRDLRVIIPMILFINLVVLGLVVRSLVAPLLLLLLNVLSAGAAIAIGSWISTQVFSVHALDLPVPLLAFLFLVALGIDYTIFLVHRARSEAQLHGTRPGMIEAVSHTGVVITSAGIVLAGVFAALGLLPLVTLGQLGIIVGIGVVMDTVLTRTVLIPALFGSFGDRMWWPWPLTPAATAKPEESADSPALAFTTAS